MTRKMKQMCCFVYFVVCELFSCLQVEIPVKDGEYIRYALVNIISLKFKLARALVYYIFYWCMGKFHNDLCTYDFIAFLRNYQVLGLVFYFCPY